MVLEPVLCPHCGSDNVGKHGRSKEGKKRYICKHDKCSHSTFLRDYTYQGCQVETKRQIIEMAVNGSGIRDTARVLRISPSTVIAQLKKRTRTPCGQYEGTQRY